MPREFPIEVIGYQIYAQGKDSDVKKSLVAKLSPERSRVFLDRINEDDTVFCDVRIMELDTNRKAKYANAELKPLEAQEVYAQVVKIQNYLAQSGFNIDKCRLSYLNPVSSETPDRQTTARRIHGNAVTLRFTLPIGQSEQFEKAATNLDNKLRKAMIHPAKAANIEL